MTSHLYPVRYEEVEVAKIIVPEGHRSPDGAQVTALAESIAEVGLLEPVGLTANYHLIYGATRLAAHRTLERKTISAAIRDLDDLRVELAEIDENITRHNLTGVEEAKALARRKEIYELLHPETKVGNAQAAGSNRVQGKHVSDKLSPTFSKDTAARTGKSPRSVERMVKIGKNLDDKATKILAGTPSANNMTTLDKLSRLPAELQRQEATKLVRRQTKTGKQAKDVGRKLQAGLKALNTVVSVVKACDLYAAYKVPLQSIKVDLEHQATQHPIEDAQLSGADGDIQPDEEVQ